MSYLSTSLPTNGVNSVAASNVSIVSHLQNGHSVTPTEPHHQHQHSHPEAFLQLDLSNSLANHHPLTFSTSPGGVRQPNLSPPNHHPHHHPELSLHLPTTPSSTNSVVATPSAISVNSAAMNGTVSNHSNVLEDNDLQDLSLEIEKERQEYMEKSKHLQEQLRTLKNEIEELKVDDKMSPLDQFHQEQQEQGDNKYSTIQKVKRGSMQSRVAFFEEL